MRHFKTVKVTVQEEVLDSVVCDCCGDEMKKGKPISDNCSIRYVHGPLTAPVEQRHDICGKCYSRVIVPFLQSMNIIKPE